MRQASAMAEKVIDGRTCVIAVRVTVDRPQDGRRADEYTMQCSGDPLQSNMPLTFGDRLWIVRKRVLAFEAVFFGAAAVGALLVWYMSDGEGDPGPVVYLFPVVVAIVLGTFPTLAYFLNRWIKRFEVTNCPVCGTFLWPTTFHAVQVAMLPRCPRCWKRLAKPVSEGQPAAAAGRKILIVVVIAAVGVVGWVGYGVVRTLGRLPEAYAAWDTGTLLVEYMKRHGDRWPASWDDLLTVMDSAEGGRIPLRGARAGDVAYARSLRERVAVDWSYEPGDPGAGGPVTRLDGGAFPVVWEGAEPNEMVRRYLAERAGGRGSAGQSIGPR